jgi:peptidoglycan/xylan/chitin deacetylase (PgdA/CDA1 family)
VIAPSLRILALVCALIAGCATPPSPQEPISVLPEAVDSGPPPGVIARNERFVIYHPGTDDTLASLALQFLGSEAAAWRIADFNGISQVEPGKAIAIPLRPLNPMAIWPEGYQTVPILTYHRVGVRTNRMEVTTRQLDEQFAFLARHGYRVVRLSELADFLTGKRELPKRAVVLTFDDGYTSTYEHAYPLLKKYGFPATVFLYTNFIGAKDALTWPQIRDMAGSGLVDFQPHSRTHANLIVRLPGETDQQYRERLDTEIRAPRDLIRRSLSSDVIYYAYPYGDANDLVLERLTQADFRLGLTVNPGGNASFAFPLMLRRTMVFGDRGLDAFKAALEVFKEIAAR